VCVCVCVCIKMWEGKEHNKRMKHIKGGNTDVDEGQRYSPHSNSAKKSQPNDGITYDFITIYPS